MRSDKVLQSLTCPSHGLPTGSNWRGNKNEIFFNLVSVFFSSKLRTLLGFSHWLDSHDSSKQSIKVVIEERAWVGEDEEEEEDFSRIRSHGRWLCVWFGQIGTDSNGGSRPRGWIILRRLHLRKQRTYLHPPTFFQFFVFIFSIAIWLVNVSPFLCISLDPNPYGFCS